MMNRPYFVELFSVIMYLEILHYLLKTIIGYIILILLAIIYIFDNRSQTSWLKHLIYVFYSLQNYQ